MSLQCFTLSNPNPNPNFKLSSSMTSLSTSSSVLMKSLHWRRTHNFLLPLPPPKSLAVGGGFKRITRRKNISIVSFSSSSREDSKPFEEEHEIEVEDLEQPSTESQEAWEQAVASFKEQALKLQSVSQEAYEVYSKKAVIALKETAEQLKIQADQATKDLSIMAKELSEEGRQYLTVAAEISPEPVKDVVETFASAENLDDVSKVCDFYIGIPYGTILAAGGFLNFMITGSISALRFGVILGGILLALSVSSLRLWRKGKATDMTLKGQAAIASILFLRDIRLVYQGLTFTGLVKTIISGGVAAFFIYRITYDKQQSRPKNLNGEVQS